MPTVMPKTRYLLDPNQNKFSPQNINIKLKGLTSNFETSIEKLTKEKIKKNLWKFGDQFNWIFKQFLIARYKLFVFVSIFFFSIGVCVCGWVVVFGIGIVIELIQLTLFIEVCQKRSLKEMRFS